MNLNLRVPLQLSINNQPLYICFRFTICFDTSSLPPPLKLGQPFQYQSPTYLPHHYCSYNTWLLQKICLLHNEDNNTGTLEDGCTGDFRLGQVIVKQWAIRSSTPIVLRNSAFPPLFLAHWAWRNGSSHCLTIACPRRRSPVQPSSRVSVLLSSS